MEDYKKEVIKMLYQQGDVLLKSCKEIKGKKLNHLTLAKGEVTGHHHTITKGEAELYEEKGTLFLKIDSDKAVLTHQEHDTITIPKGDYESQEKQLEIETQARVLDIQAIKTKFTSGCKVIVPRDLSQPGETRQHPVALGIFGYISQVFLNEHSPLRSWADKAHLTAQDIE